MGGAIGLGNWTPAAEFNVWADPEAADAVLRSDVPVTMIPLEVTHQALATPEVMARIDAIDTPVSAMAGELMRFFATTYRHVFGFAAPAVHDPCAVAWVIDGGTTVTTRRMHVAVETSSSLCDGRTVCDVYGMTGHAPNVTIGIDLDAERLWTIVVDAIASYRA
jgi:inosine-uridine nucleoside N-ribohydrolase